MTIILSIKEEIENRAGSYYIGGFSLVLGINMLYKSANANNFASFKLRSRLVFFNFLFNSTAVPHALVRLAPVAWVRITVLPLALIAIVQTVCGSYYETNDDTVMLLLLRGISAAAPVSNLHLYLNGWSYILAALYGWAPEFPWYDTLLTAMLYVSLATAYYVLEIVAGRQQRSWHILSLELLFFGAAFLPNVLQVNFTRPAVLLGAGAGLLLALPAPAGRLATVCRWIFAGAVFAAGWGVRPPGAELGILFAAPLWLMQPVRRIGETILYIGIITGVLILGAQLRESPDALEYSKVNTIRSQAFDYGYYEFKLQTQADSLAYATMQGGNGPYDPQLINEAFFQRCLRLTPQTQALAYYQARWVVLMMDLKRWQYLALALTLYGGFVGAMAFMRRKLIGRYRAVLVFGLYHGFFG